MVREGRGGAHQLPTWDSSTAAVWTL